MLYLIKITFIDIKILYKIIEFYRCYQYLLYKLYIKQSIYNEKLNINEGNSVQ